MNIDDIPNLVNVIQSTVKKKTNKDPIQPISGTIVPRFAGPHQHLLDYRS